MLPKKNLVPINELQVGMVSSMDINFEGTILLAKDFPITEAIIDKLKKTYIISSVEVYLDDEIDNPLTPKMQEVKKLENTLNNFSSNLKSIFDSLSSSKTPKLDDIRTFTLKVKNEFTSTGIVIKNIIFYGSKNDSIYRHSLNVAAISFMLGKWLNLDSSDLTLLMYASILHDFGKIRISKDILDKKGNLTINESEVFKSHPVIGYHFVKQIPYISSSVSYAVLLHHERMDGSGYPLHIKQDKIPSFAKIIAIADLFDEVSSNRYSSEVRGPLEALKAIKDESLMKLDCNYCDVFLTHMINYYIGEHVVLSNKHSCKIIKINMNDLSKPLLMDDNEFLDLKNEKDLYIEKLVI